jgi:hypothetical protein
MTRACWWSRRSLVSRLSVRSQYWRKRPSVRLRGRDSEFMPFGIKPRNRPNRSNRLDRAVGVSTLRAFLEGYHDTAEANQPTASQSTAHNPNDRNNTAVIDTRPDQ